MKKRGLLSFAPMVMVSALFASAQSPMAAPPTTPPSGWQRVQGLGPHSKIRVKSDTKDTICFFHFADDEQLTCSDSENIGATTLTFPRKQIQSIKLSHWVIGTLDDIIPGPFLYRR